jgi:hypothetical protein
MKINITRVVKGDYRVKISSPDKDEFYAAIEALKNSIPSYHREFDGASRRWIITSESGLYTWLYIVEDDMGAEVIWDHEQQAVHKQAAPTNDELFAALHLLPTAPPELIKSAYRILAARTHPDHGGSEFEMKKLNLVYEKLKVA